MLASIIITNYNYGRYIGRCLRSCLKQTLPIKDYEIIIVDDKSTNQSPTTKIAYYCSPKK